MSCLPFPSHKPARSLPWLRPAFPHSLQFVGKVAAEPAAARAPSHGRDARPAVHRAHAAHCAPQGGAFPHARSPYLRVRVWCIASMYTKLRRRCVTLKDARVPSFVEMSCQHLRRNLHVQLYLLSVRVNSGAQARAQPCARARTRPRPRPRLNPTYTQAPLVFAGGAACACRHWPQRQPAHQEDARCFLALSGAQARAMQPTALPA
eukprot:6189323-Pleurochrysis_carterae.AAC.4